MTGTRHTPRSLPSWLSRLCVIAVGAVILSTLGGQLPAVADTPDSTPPRVVAVNVERWATYRVGEVPAAGCEASDEGSGLAAPCVGELTGGTDGLGEFTYTATATDRAGNTGTATVTYFVIADTPADAEVTGTVRTADGTPQQGNVEARSAGTPILVASTQADMNGSYTLALPAGSYDFRVVGSDSAGLFAGELARTITPGANPIDWTLGVGDLTLSGTIVGSDGRVWAGAQVGLRSSSSSNYVSADEQGRFTLQMAAGPYQLYVSKTFEGDLHFRTNWFTVTEDREVTLTVPMSTVQVHLRDSNDNPVDGAIHASNCDVSSGSLPELATGIPTRVLRARNTAVTTASGTATLTLAPGCTTTLTVTPNTGPEVTTTITSETPQWTVTTSLSEDTTPPRVSVLNVERWATYRVGEAPTPACEASDTDPGLAAPCVGELTGGTDGLGEFTYTATATDRAGNTGTATVTYFVIADTPADAEVTGTVRTADGTPQQGNVEARSAGTPILVASTQADMNGSYTLALPAGSYDFRVVGSDSAGLFAGELARTITPGANPIDWTLGVGDLTLSGTIVGSDGRVWAGAQVGLIAGSTSNYFSADEQGHFTVRAAAGPYQLYVSKTFEGYLHFRTGWFLLTEDREVTLTVPTPTVQVHLRDPNDNPVNGTIFAKYCDVSGGNLPDLAPGIPSRVLRARNTTVTTTGGTATLHLTPGCTANLTVTPAAGPELTKTITSDIPEWTVATTLFDDTTPPQVSVVNLERWATYRVGEVPTPACEASDPDPGLAGPCVGELTGGTDGLGEFTYTATATDRAGNTGTASVTYFVIPVDNAVVTGTVRDDAGTPVREATVEARLPGSQALAASGLTEADGTYTLALPAGSYDFRVMGSYYTMLLTTERGRSIASGANVVDWTLGRPAADSTPPRVVAVNVERWATYRVGEVPAAGCEASDEGSGLAAPCVGELTGGTDGLGEFTYTATATDRAGNTGTATVTYFVIADTPADAEVTGTVRTADGTPQQGNVEARSAGTPILVASTQADMNGSYTLALPAGSYDFRVVGSDSAGLFAGELARTITPGANPIDWTLGVGDLTLSGTIVGSDGRVWAGAQVGLIAGSTSNYFSADEQGHFTVRAAAGPYQLYVSKTFEGYLHFRTGWFLLTEDREVTLTVPTPTVQVHLRDPNDNPVNGTIFAKYCDVSGGNLPDLAPGIPSRVLRARNTTVTTTGGTATLHLTPGCTANLTVTLASGLKLVTPITSANPDWTVYTWPGMAVPEAPANLSDDDNVPPATEAQVPSRDATGAILPGASGDGNGDGVPDARQPNVTSLPALGSSAIGSDAAYVTIAAPEGTTLGKVVTIDPADTSKIEVSPPQGFTLPEGLTSFIVEGVSVGETKTISVYSGSVAGVTGYAKYNPATKEWSTLPGDRVTIYPDHVDISLTDGGVGDADGEANGIIDDPGGPVIIPDSTPPTVAGTVSPTANAAGWRKGDVTVAWTATDPAPSSGGVVSPASTRVHGEGANLTAVSAQVCDNAGNCAKGTVIGIKIDQTPPTVTIEGATATANPPALPTYQLGAAPTLKCKAADALSGLDGSCVTTLTGGNANAVGTFTYTAKATDHAGNSDTATYTFRVVYRVDGFLQPINDPRLTPGTNQSIFKAGSNVPVKLQVRRADGTVVTPLEAPQWVTPIRGVAVAGAPNEPDSGEPVTTGGEFQRNGDQWHYNWKTPKTAAGYWYTVGAKLDDGTVRTVVIGLK